MAQIKKIGIMQDKEACPGALCPHRVSCWRYVIHQAAAGQHRAPGDQPGHIKQNGSCYNYWHTKQGSPIANPDRIKAHTLEGWQHLRLSRNNYKDSSTVQQRDPDKKKKQ